METAIHNQQPDAVIFESGYTGHRAEYVSHVMNYINQHHPLHGKFLFILNEQIQQSLGTLSESSNFRIQYFSFPPKHANSVKRSFWEWKMLCPFFESHPGFKEITFLDIDPYLVLLATRRFSKFGMKVNGILFQPYIHFSNFKNIKPLVKSYLFQRSATLLNPRIRRLYVLNDRNGVVRLNKRIKNIFHFLPDPIDDKPVPILSRKAILDKFGVTDSKKILLLFGRIDRRKNLLNIIEGLNSLPPEVKENVRLVIAGSFAAEVRKEYLSKIGQCRGVLSISYNDGFVTDEEREVLFQHSDIVLMPYINFFSSSGVLGHSIKNHKSVIVANTGIVAGMVREQHIGLTVDPLDPIAIGNAITRLLSSPAVIAGANNELISQHSPSNFSRVLLTESA